MSPSGQAGIMELLSHDTFIQIGQKGREGIMLFDFSFWRQGMAHQPFGGYP